MPEQFWVKEDHRAPLVISLVGPIEYWWDTPDEPDRFNSPAAVAYRAYRDELSEWLTTQGYLVYRPHEAFKGGWDERAQAINDFAITQSDLVIEMTPKNVPTGKGTLRELDLADSNSIRVMWIPEYFFRLNFSLIRRELHQLARAREDRLTGRV